MTISHPRNRRPPPDYRPKTNPDTITAGRKKAIEVESRGGEEGEGDECRSGDLGMVGEAREREKDEDDLELERALHATLDGEGEEEAEEEIIYGIARLS